MFCGDCGTPLPWRCNACGGENPADKRFCGDCGAARGVIPDTALPAAAIAPVPERRFLSVMFIDLADSTALGQRLDPEDVREVIAAFHGVVRGLLARFEGFVARYMGDGVLVYFGYPQAHEADVERAIRAGLTIVEAVASLKTLAGPSGTLKVRIGIDTGLVIVGDLIGFGASLETAVVGDAPNLAARLQASAEPNTVVISDTTRLLVGSLFEYRELVLSNLKGRRGSERAWLVLGESLIDSRYEALRRGQASLVGRTEDLEFMLRRWEQVMAGEGRVILLSGDPGIGKSRLVAALVECIGTSLHLCLRFFCSPHYLDTPLHPFARYIERAAKLRRGDSPATKWNKLSGILPPGASPEEKALLADLVAIQPVDHEPIGTLNPQNRKAKTFATIVRQIGLLSGGKPILVLVEDVHWADPSTLELLHQLVDAVQQRPVLLILTTRLGLRPAWVSRSHVTVHLLGSLDRPSAVALVQQVAGGRELPQKVIDRIITRADNIPLFIEELTKTVLKSIEGNSPGDSASSLEPLSPDAVPSSLHSSLTARLDRHLAGKEIAQIGAVIGREFSFDLVQAVSALPASKLEPALAELAQDDIIVAHGQPPFANYVFKHALVQDAAYASLLRERRRAIHLRVAEEIEKDAADEMMEPQLIAWHFSEAGIPDKAIDYYQKAATRATGRFALAEMANHLRNALRQLARVPASSERDHRELALQLTLGRTLIDFEGGNSEAVREAFERARELCFALDDLELLPRVYDGLVANHHYIRSNPDKINEFIDEMAEVHRKTGDPRAMLMITRAKCLANFLLGRFEAARESMQNLIEIYDVERDRPQAGTTSRDPRAAMSTFLGICLTILGHPDAGTAQTRSGIEYVRTLNHPVSLNLGLRRGCVQGMLRRNTEQVIAYSGELAALYAKYETYQGSWEGAFFQDWAKLSTQPDPVRSDRVHAFLSHFDRSHIWAMLPFYMASAAEFSGRHRDVARARALLDRADELINVTGARWCEAEVTRLRAHFCARSTEESVTLLRTSLAKAKEQGARLWQLRTATDLARLLLEKANHAEANEVLRPVYEWFSEGRDAADCVAARALLSEIDQRHQMLVDLPNG
jgi:class 3 adenylate cyclase